MRSEQSPITQRDGDVAPPFRAGEWPGVKGSVIAAFGDDAELPYPELVSRLPSMAELDLRAALIALVDVDRRLTVTGHRGPGDDWSSLTFHRT